MRVPSTRSSSSAISAPTRRCGRRRGRRDRPPARRPRRRRGTTRATGQKQERTEWHTVIATTSSPASASGTSPRGASSTSRGRSRPARGTTRRPAEALRHGDQGAGHEDAGARPEGSSGVGPAVTEPAGGDVDDDVRSENPRGVRRPRVIGTAGFAPPRPLIPPAREVPTFYENSRSRLDSRGFSSARETPSLRPPAPPTPPA